MNFTPNEYLFYYLYYIQERMNIFWKRLEGNQPPYSEDVIFNENKFTNVYRVLDRSSQYLVKNIINTDKDYSVEETFWRILIYKHFNLPHTWDLLIKEFGDIDKNVSLNQISSFLAQKKDSSDSIYSNAYMMTSAFLSGDKGRYVHLKENKWRKHQYYFYIFEKELIEEGKLYDILSSKSFKGMFDAMKSVTSFGDFTTYQYCQDLNYTKFFDFDDNEFCAAGPGTIRGIQHCFDLKGKVDFGDIVKWTFENYEKLVEEYSNELDVDLSAKIIPGWGFKVPDFSNSFCETFKYIKQTAYNNGDTSQGRMKQKFHQNKNVISEFTFPKKWGVQSIKSL